MTQEMLFTVLADAILIVHFLFVLFVVFGLFFIFLGHALKWQWVKNRRFRIFHLLAIGIVVFQSWIGVICPLTTWEMTLREAAGAETYAGSFIQHWLQSLLYYTAPEWIFIVLYTGFGALVLASWYVVRPHSRAK
ncbi:DUF2784 domain-containing protein [Maricurvus nonylphenolicus]|uniref:DUF2784 domain-containing protein n=1 Tax=Maricurvus nonylphenolicus TaxID=1008307 RepID=UPI0036F351D2